MTLLTVFQEDRTAALGRRSTSATASARFAQRVKAGLVGRADVEHPGGRVRRAAAPVGPAEFAGGRYLIAAQSGRSEDPLVARVGDDLAKAGAFGVARVRVDIVDGELEACKRRRHGRKGLRRP